LSIEGELGSKAFAVIGSIGLGEADGVEKTREIAAVKRPMSYRLS
jgi:hypothetical protein